jgi:hypothetical protein
LPVPGSGVVGGSGVFNKSIVDLGEVPTSVGFWVVDAALFFNASKVLGLGLTLFDAGKILRPDFSCVDDSGFLSFLESLFFFAAPDVSVKLEAISKADLALSING